MDLNIDMRTVQSTAKTGDRQSRQLEKLRQSSQELEAMFLNEMYKAMRKTVPEDGLFQKTQAEKMYEEMQDMEMARTVSRNSSMGLADAIFQQMAPLVVEKREE